MSAFVSWKDDRERSEISVTYQRHQGRQPSSRP
jgi:hypothetical protein